MTPIYPNKDDYDEKFWRNNYRVLITGQGIEYIVNADNEQEAIDFIIDHAEENAPGLVASYQELIDDGMSDDEIEEYINGGNHCLYLTTHNIHIETIQRP